MVTGHRMRALGIATLVTVVCLGTVHCTAATKVPKGFAPLFNGKDLSGWKGLVENPKSRKAMPEEELAKAQAAADALMRAHWQVVDGVLEYDGHGNSLCTAKDYGDFELYIDWKIKPGGDSGIYLRGSPQIQIWDPEHEPFFVHGADQGSGALWNNQKYQRFPLVKADNPAGEWNTFYIRMIGERVTVQLNGQVVMDNVIMENFWQRDRPIYPRGQIELQHHEHKLWFRNIYIREIGAQEANQILSEANGQHFDKVFNGHDFDGWEGGKSGYHVADGVLACKKGDGGILHTQKQYSNFIVRLEFKLPPGGNNGLAIRYPGHGSAHVDGMTELQILGDDYPDINDLDPRQLHGSAYGLVAAHQGYLHAANEWNFQQVTVIGSQIKVELNGFTILDTNLTEVRESKDGGVYPNVQRMSGHFGFVGHGDLVAFRNISIKELAAEQP